MLMRQMKVALVASIYSAVPPNNGKERGTRHPMLVAMAARTA